MSERQVTEVTPASVVGTYGTNVKMCIIDSRDSDYNNNGHVKDAINIPEWKFRGNDVERLVNQCVEDGVSWIIFYCQYGQQRSVKAANSANRYINSLEEKPLIQISYIEGGFDAFYRKYRKTEYVEN